MEQHAVIAIAGDATMVVSVHASDAEAQDEASRQRKRRPQWSFYVETVVDQTT